jgi:hypothetical protein
MDFLCTIPYMDIINVSSGGGGSNPGSLGQYIRNTLNSGGSVTKKTTSGNAPSNTKGC